MVFIQVVRGVKFGEYRCDKDEDLAMVAAQQYYIEFGGQLCTDKLTHNLPTYIPDYCVADTALPRYVLTFMYTIKSISN